MAAIFIRHRFAAVQRAFRAGILLACALAAACGDSGEPQATEGAAGGEGGAPAPKRTRQVVVLTPHGQEMMDEYEKAFEAAHPEIDVLGRFVPTGQVLSQLRIDKSSPKVDVWWGGTSAFFNEAKNEELLAPYEPTWAASCKPEYRDAEHYWYAQFLQIPAIIFNERIYQAEAMPATWDGLLDPKWKDKIVIREPLDSGTLKTIFTGIIWHKGGAAHDPAPGYEYLKQLDAQTRSYLPNPQALYDRIAKSSEGYISLWNLTDAIFQREANKYPIKYRIPEDPVPVSLDPIGIIAGAPHMEEAKLFYEFVTSKESELKLARDHFRILARSDIAPEELPEVLRGVKFTPLSVDLKEFDRLQGEWMKHWRENIRDPRK